MRCGTRACFHGAFGSRAAADAKAEARGGKVLKRKIRRQTRYVVVTGKK